MIDIITADENGLGVFDTQVSKAKNILSVQLGSLEYAQSFGIDLKYFLSENIKFQDSSFKSYLVERLANSGINIAEVIDLVETLSAKYTFKITPEETQDALIAR